MLAQLAVGGGREAEALLEESAEVRGAAKAQVIGQRLDALSGAGETQAGLVAEVTLSSWDLRPFTVDSTFLVAVLARSESPA